jgi:hypothetical protein
MKKSMEQKYKIYSDLDGVLVDFIKGYYDLTGRDITGSFHSDDAFWAPIDNARKDFWINLSWTKDGKKLWDYIKKYNPIILSSPSSSPYGQNDSRVGKFEWVQRELPGTHLILRSPDQKKEFAKPDTILIDDRESNITDWDKMGGIAILHTSANDTIKQLQKLKL